MTGMGFKPMTTVFKWAKMVHGLDRTTTVIGSKETVSVLQARDFSYSGQT
jgi:hypothetical protein